VALEGLGVGQPFPGIRSEDRAQKLVDLVHQRVVIQSRAIPLEDRKLGVVPIACLAVADCLADLVDRPAAGGEQPLHGELRGGLKKEIPSSIGAGAAVPTAQGLEVEVGDRRRGEQGSFHLEDLALGEEHADLRQDLSAQAKHLHRSGRAPGVAFRGHCRATPRRVLSFEF
jgi:hypothetical protein